MFRETSISDISNASTEILGAAKIDEKYFIIENNGVLHKKVSLVSQTSGTDNEIEAMLNAYYNTKTLLLADIQSTQAIGDIRQGENSISKRKMVVDEHTITIPTRTLGSQYDSYTIPYMENVKQVIIDFNHDNLKNPINNISKALITIQMVGMVNNRTAASGNSGEGPMYAKMNTENNNTGGQNKTPARLYCNTNFYNALGFKNQVKQVIKQNCKVYNSETLSTTDDYCFFLSSAEVFDFNSDYTMAAEGEQYSYFEIASNRVKKHFYTGEGNATGQWLRSPNKNYSYSYCIVNSSGEASSGDASSTSLIASISISMAI